jgi:glutamate/tyrosine decarboxylase-like PLP-dependent enzyme
MAATAANDECNRLAVRAMQADGRAFVTGTVWNGRAAIRAAFDNWQTSAADIALLEAAVEHVARGLQPQSDADPQAGTRLTAP